MNAGIISTRYARAIYEFASERGEETALYREMKVLAQNFSGHPAMRRVMNDPVLSPEEKIKTLSIAAGVDISALLQQILRVVVRNGRANYMENIALMYDQVYRKAKGIVVAHLTTVTPADEPIRQTLVELISKVIENKTVEFHSETDPGLIGGFVLDIEDNRLDASVKGQLNQIKCQI
ncbi:MAG: F0F1 ATP synthase subunit delta [Dysgonamonadaceae bacterium]|jgi:F-type H+-transporting ATPase subunit delta|nr:F0F1 ATP synthase subunit delta [Dysgonamonadaceae bacterium]